LIWILLRVQHHRHRSQGRREGSYSLSCRWRHHITTATACLLVRHPMHRRRSRATPSPRKVRKCSCQTQRRRLWRLMSARARRRSANRRVHTLPPPCSTPFCYLVISLRDMIDHRPARPVAVPTVANRQGDRLPRLRHNRQSLPPSRARRPLGTTPASLFKLPCGRSGQATLLMGSPAATLRYIPSSAHETRLQTRLMRSNSSGSTVLVLLSDRASRPSLAIIRVCRRPRSATARRPMHPACTRKARWPPVRSCRSS